MIALFEPSSFLSHCCLCCLLTICVIEVTADLPCRVHLNCAQFFLFGLTDPYRKIVTLGIPSIA